MTTSTRKENASLILQAERMVRRRRIDHAAGNIGDNVTVPIPLVDRGRSDLWSIMGIIVDRDMNDMYKIAVCGGILKGKYSRNQFDLCAHKLLTDRDVDQNQEIALRNAVQHQSNCGGQGFVKCNCSGSNRYQSNR